MGFEGIGASRERALDQDHKIASAHEMAVTNVESRCIQMSDYVKVFGSEEIQVDQQLLEMAEKKFAERDAQRTGEDSTHHILGDIAEGILLGHTDGPFWFGNQAKLIPTSRFDDVRNRTDFLAPLGGEKSLSSWLGINATVGYWKQSTFDSIKEDIDADQLAEVKYAPWKLQGVEAPRDLTPLVVLGVSRSSLESLMEMYINPRARKELLAHPVRHLYIEEALTQLKAFHAYASRKGKERAASAFAARIPHMERIAREMAERYPPPSGDAWKKDALFHTLQESARAFADAR